MMAERAGLLLRRILACAALVVSWPDEGRAVCNLIPPAEKLFPSAMGAIDSPIAAPGDWVEIRLRPCDSTSARFDPTPASNLVRVVFTPPTGVGAANETAVTVSSADVVVDDCPVGSPCPTLRFKIPSTVATFPPYGLAGPARIEVENGGLPAAQIATLHEPTSTCDQVPETVFRKFTVLPAPNVFGNVVSGTATKLLATLDGDQNLIVPFDYLSVLPQGVGAPVARFLTGSTDVDAFGGQPGLQPIVIPSSDYVRSFTIDGRPLPPLLRVDASGRVLFGTADGARGILRIARDGGAGGPAIYDFTDRLYGDKGPIVIDRVADNVSAGSGAAVPLRGLRSSAKSVGYARDESIEGADLNGDLDQTDSVVQLVDPDNLTLVSPETNTGHAVVEVRAEGRAVPAIQTEGQLVAYVESEALQRVDRNGDGDWQDGVLRAFELGGASPVDQTAGVPLHQLVADAAPALGGRTLAVSNELIFFRTPESGRIPQVTQRASSAAGGLEANAYSEATPNGALSADGRYLAFATLATDVVGGAPGARKAVVYDRLSGAHEDVGVDSSEAPCSGNQWPSISADGRFVAFTGVCSSLLLPGETTDYVSIYVRDRQAGTTARVSFAAGSTAPNGHSENARLSADGRFVAFESLASNLVAGDSNGVRDVFLYDRDSDGNGVFDERPAGVELHWLSVSPAGNAANSDSRRPVVSDDGRVVAFDSGAGNLLVEGAPATATQSVFARATCIDALGGCTPTTELISACATGSPGSGLAWAPAISADGRFVAFESSAPNLLSPDCSPAGDNNLAFDVFLLDRETRAMERLSVDPAGFEVTGGDSYAVSLSADARVATFVSSATNLVPGDGNAKADIFVHDRVSGTTARVSVSTAGAEVTTCTLPTRCSWQPSLSADGRVVAFESESAELVAPDTAGGAKDVFVHGPDPVAAGYDLDGSGVATDTVLQVLDTRGVGAGTLRTLARVAAGEAAIADGRALIVPGDPLDPALLYDGNPLGDAAPETLDAAASRVALSDAVLALTEPGLSRDVLRVRMVAGGGPTTDTGLGADAIAAVGEHVAFATVEATEGSSPGSDLNGDGDYGDRVLRIYHLDSDPGTPELLPVAEAVDDFVAQGHLVAFRTPECDQAGSETTGCPSGGTDLNGDGDAGDEVMQVYNLETGELLSTEQAAMACTIPGCEPGVTYRVKGDTVAFLTYEPDQGGLDLDGNGSNLDVVVQLFNTVSLAAQVYSVSSDATAGEAPSPFPEDLIDDPILYVTSAEGVGCVDTDLDTVIEPEDGCPDLDDDGVITMGKVVTLVVGDQDDDGVFDESASSGDSCVEASNADQLDSDLDGLGDACDALPTCKLFTPTTPTAAPDGTVKCQKAIGKAASAYSKKHAAAAGVCLRDLAAGKIAGDATELCRGAIIGGLATPPGHAKTAEKVAKARAQMRAALGRSCSDALVAQLDTCAASPGGATVDSLSSCVSGAYGDSVLAATRFSWGSLAPISDSAERKCQVAAGGAAADYLTALVKAMGTCLDLANEGKAIAANCLGSSTADGALALPGDATVRSKIEAAQAKLLSRVTKSCPGALLQEPEIASCGDDPQGVSDCFACPIWRRAVESLRAAYGPNPG